MDGGSSEDILTSSCLLLFSTTAFSFFLLGKKDLNLLNPGEDFPKGQSFSERCGIDFLSFIAFFSTRFFLGLFKVSFLTPKFSSLLKK